MGVDLEKTEFAFDNLKGQDVHLPLSRRYPRSGNFVSRRYPRMNSSAMPAIGNVALAGRRDMRSGLRLHAVNEGVGTKLKIHN